MPNRDAKLLLADIREAMVKVECYVENLSYDEFIADGKTVDAVVRNFEVIGEAARQLPDKFKQQHSAVPWRDLADFRNVLIHEYFGVDLKLVWQIIELDLAELKRRLAAISGEGCDGASG